MLVPAIKYQSPILLFPAEIIFFSLITFYRIIYMLHMKIMLENTSTIVCEHIYTLKIRGKKVTLPKILETWV